MEIGNYVKTHSRVFIPQYTIIHDYVWLFPGVILTDDPHPPSEVRAGTTIKSFAARAAGVTILPGLVIEQGCLIAAGSTLTKNTVPDTVWVGNPAKCAGPTSTIRHKEKNISAYPWQKHFYRGYPDEVVRSWNTDDRNC
ncbi:MAG: hypothetical protein D3908_16185 [Candidatus Electrothrix sp. AUS4]|nr:hypothetical protein [Candidatus Electrothrix sp. AUS4]